MAYYTVHDWMGTELGLRGMEKQVYAVIYSYSINDLEYVGSSETLANRVGCSRRTVLRAFNTLVEKGLIIRKGDGRFRSYSITDRGQNVTIRGQNDTLSEGQNVAVEGHNVTLGVTPCHSRVTKSPQNGDMMSHNNKDNKDNNKSYIKGDREGNTHAPDNARGYFNNVILSDREYLDLINEYPQSMIEDYIERLSEYMKSTGRKYESHCATIRNWIRSDQKKNGGYNMDPRDPKNVDEYLRQLKKELEAQGR